MERMIICYCVVLFISLSIGLPCWLVGCNPDVTNGCITRQLVNMTYTQKTIESGVCCEWCETTTCDTSGSDSTEHCTTTSYCCGGSSCFSCKYDFVDSKNSNKKCTEECSATYDTASEAMSAPSSYQLNQKYWFAYDDRTNLCQDAYQSKKTWIVGISFLSLGAAVTVVPLLSGLGVVLFYIGKGIILCLSWLIDLLMDCKCECKCQICHDCMAQCKRRCSSCVQSRKKKTKNIEVEINDLQGGKKKDLVPDDFTSPPFTSQKK